MLNVFLTVDTEAWPLHADWRERRMADDIRRDIDGATADGDFGIGYQMKVLNEHGLKGVFFVESLFACAVGLEPLRRIVGAIQEAGHDVQLHIHTEWLRWTEDSCLPGRIGRNMKDFTEHEQTLLVARAVENLKAAGAKRVCAFRAGNYGADFDTLRALARNGISFDSSHNTCYLDSDCGMRTPGWLLQPTRINGVQEFPVAFFRDRPGHYRHAQLCACSAREMRNALLDAWRREWHSFVIVSHGFEMLRRRKQTRKPVLPDRIVIRRFESLCRFLADHRDKFRTATFAEVDPEDVAATAPAQPLWSSTRHTAWRYVEQLARRVVSEV
jgi:hypothetical protein